MLALGVNQSVKPMITGFTLQRVLLPGRVALGVDNDQRYRGYGPLVACSDEGIHAACGVSAGVEGDPDGECAACVGSCIADRVIDGSTRNGKRYCFAAVKA